MFTVNNAFKDLNYIHALLIDMPDAKKLSHVNKLYYKNAIKKRLGNLLISELIRK